MTVGKNIDFDHPKWVLGSASPRRQSLLKLCGMPFQVVVSGVDEYQNVGEMPQEFALRMAEEKAMDVAQKNPQATVVIGGDTVVALGNKILGKPVSETDAVQTLERLSGQEHQVWSAWAIAGVNASGQMSIRQSGVTCSTVTMRQLNKQEILDYVLTGEPLDKAGSYGIQGKGGRFVDQLSGSFFAVIGLPVIEIFTALSTMGEVIGDTELIKNVITLKEKAAQATWRSGRSLEDVELLAVSKKHSLRQIESVYNCHIHHFGESYFQELAHKTLNMDEERTSQIQWHYIGALQSKKAKKIGEMVHWVHGLTREVEADKLAQGARNTQRVLKAFIQVNLSSESSKGGLKPNAVKTLLDHCQALEGIEVVGLMTFPPLAPPEENRHYFKSLRILRDELEQDGYSLPHLSMGTSDDFEVAIEEGATWVRLGRCLFGERQ